MNHFKILFYLNRDAKVNSRKCDVCNIDVQRASYAKHLRSKNLLENRQQNEKITPKWLFQEPIEIKIKKYIIPNY